MISVGFDQLTKIWGHFRPSQVISEGLKGQPPFVDYLNLILKSGLFENLNERNYERCLIKLKEAFGNILVFLFSRD